MKKIFSLLLCALFTQIVFAQKQSPITVAINATHIAWIKQDTIAIIKGSTYRFTVDTPEDSGLVSTGIGSGELLQQLNISPGMWKHYSIRDAGGRVKEKEALTSGDRLVVTGNDGRTNKKYYIKLVRMALPGKLWLEQSFVTAGATGPLTIFFTAGQRSPDATVRIYLPQGITVSASEAIVNVIGRGDVKLKDLATQSIGRAGTKYSYSKVGEVSVQKFASGGSVITLRHLDLRPSNGADVKLVIPNVKLLKPGKQVVKASYTTSQPEVLSSTGTGSEVASLIVTPTIADFRRMQRKNQRYTETPDTYTQVHFQWSKGADARKVQLLRSEDGGKSWKQTIAELNSSRGEVKVSGLQPLTHYLFRLKVNEGAAKGLSNTVAFFSGRMDIKNFGVTGDSLEDATLSINLAIDSVHRMGGGTLLFSRGVYAVRTVHLKSNVYLYIDSDARIQALKGGDAPETTWFSDKKYRSGLSPTDTGPYADPENYLTKQDVGHHYFRNAMFFGERLDNVKFIGTGRITGNGNLVTGDRVMNNAPDNRSDKMFSLKLCTNIEIGGIYRDADLWYDPVKDEPYYLVNGKRSDDLSNMLHIDRGGHFVLLATGTDGIYVHNTYFARESRSNARDIYDFMACNDVTVTNIYSKVSSDDIVKPGSDCALGFTRPARKYRVRNIIGDTNCNLFQIGSETVDDIMDICVDNIYVLGANKAGFSISTNDGAHIKDIHLNCGHTGPIHSRSKMLRTFAPFFVSISNRGRVLGAEAARYSFTENGVKRNELLVNNIPIGKVENIIINGIDISETFGGSSYNGPRWKPYDGTQRRATSIIAGYSLPHTSVVEGGLPFTLPGGNTAYITNISFNDVHILAKGGNPLSDTAASPPELGVGQYNISNLKVQPSYGIWARHVKGLQIDSSSFSYEQRDNRYALFLDDVHQARISHVHMLKAADNPAVIRLKNASDVRIEEALYFQDRWGNEPVKLTPLRHRSGNALATRWRVNQ